MSPLPQASQPTLSDSQLERAAGVLVAQAVGDAMGAPYEPGHVPLTTPPQMVGGGYGHYAPAEWTDDTQMSLYIAEVAATGADLTSPEALDKIARGWCRWVVEEGATDVGNQTRDVIDAVSPSRDEPGIAQRMRQAAADLHARTGMTAGNGALMRNGIVALTRLTDRQATAAAVRAVAELTHADPLAGDACVIHAEMIRENVMNPAWENLPMHGANPMRILDLIPGERRQYWHDFFDGGPADPSHYDAPPHHDGFAVHALAQATLAFTFANRCHYWNQPLFFDTREETSAWWMSTILMQALTTSQDKDTVAAIAGALAGSYLGAGAAPQEWVKAIHGLPRGEDGAERTAVDLRELATRTALAGLGR